ncbi:MAG: creatininase family protein [Gemmatimonadaceae bacterium]|nr:creatininase family protein [Gemmatimonadaceae bacterium]
MTARCPSLHTTFARSTVRTGVSRAAAGLAMALGVTATALAQGAPPANAAPSMGGGQCSANPYNCPTAVNPIPAANTVWLEEMTWMDVRDAIKAGKTTVILTTGGIEPNGPWIALGKHNYVLHQNCEAIARKMGNALCAPTVKFVPEGGAEPPTGHMLSPGTITMRESTFRAILTDIIVSLKAHGFTQMFLIGDSGGNQNGQRAVADSLNKLWGGMPLVAHIQEYYDYPAVTEHMKSKGLVEGTSDGLHDDAIISLNIFADDPSAIRLDQRVKAGKATINGVSLADKKKNAAMAKEIIAFRTESTITAINKAIANKGTLPAPPRRRPGA